MKRCQTVVCRGLTGVVVMLLLMCGMTAFSANLRFASGGKALVKIATGEPMAKYDAFAAEDLQRYLGGMAGAEFQVVKEADLAPGEAAIYLGQTKAAESLGLKAESFAREEWCIRCMGEKGLVITGGLPIGTFYGVWAALNHLGCYALTWDQDAIPNQPELSYDGFEEQRKPVFGGRMIYDHQIGIIRRSSKEDSLLKTYYRWILRNYVNGRQDNAPMPYYVSGVFHIPHRHQYHSMETYLPADKYFESHPEYYWMTENGRRERPPRPGYNGGLCMSNPEVVRLVLARLREMIEEDRKLFPKEEWPTVYDISRMDGSRYFCKCPKCLEIEKVEGSQQALFYRFLNQIAEPIAKEYPELTIRTFGGLDESDKPDHSRPLDNVLLWISDKYTISDCFRPLTNPINDEQRQRLERISKDGKRFMIWDYWNLGGKTYFTPPRVETTFNALQPDIQFFRKMGATDMFIEVSTDDGAPQNFIPLCYFVAYQLMIDPERDAEKLADVFIQYYFGPNAELMRQWFKEIRAGVAVETRRQPSMGAVRWSYCDGDFMLNSYKRLKAAAAALPEGDIYRKRLEYEMIALVWGIIADWRLWEKQFLAENIGFEGLAEECRHYAREFVERYTDNPKRVTDLYVTGFEDRFNLYAQKPPIPEKFKDVPEENLLILGYAGYLEKRTYGAWIVPDKEAICGRAFCGGNKSEEFHGANKVIGPFAKHGFKTTYFEAAGAKCLIETVPEDEKYHWYKMEGKATIRPEHCSFWGQGWAIHAKLGVFYNPDDPKDNVWDEVWMRAKFTGPAYVPGSTRKNAMFLDQVVFVRK